MLFLEPVWDQYHCLNTKACLCIQPFIVTSICQSWISSLLVHLQLMKRIYLAQPELHSVHLLKYWSEYLITFLFCFVLNRARFPPSLYFRHRTYCKSWICLLMYIYVSLLYTLTWTNIRYLIAYYTYLTSKYERKLWASIHWAVRRLNAKSRKVAKQRSRDGCQISVIAIGTV